MLHPENADIIVIGAGPAGLTAAMEAASQGVEVVVLEEHKEVGVPNHCAGLLSVNGLKRIGIAPSRDFVQNEIKGARFHSPSGLEFTVGGREIKAYVVNRTLFDKVLWAKAAQLGVNTQLGVRAVSLIHRNKNTLAVKTRNGVLESKIVIDCEGSNPTLLKEIGLKPSKKILPAIQFEANCHHIDSEYVHIFVGRKIAPGFFAYIIPTSSHSVRVGLACEEANPRELLQSFIRKELKGCEITAIQGGLIPISGPIPRTYDAGFLIAGDAAGHTKPTTGGGVITGAICAKIAGRVAAEAIKQSVCSAKFLEKYQKLWKEELRKEFSTMLLARKIANSLSDKTLDRIFQTIIINQMQSLIEEKGDIDFQSGVLYAMAKQPALIKLLFMAVHDLMLTTLK